MMPLLTQRPAHTRGYADHGWLQSYHSFSFAQYYDPQHMGVGNLRVINDDVIAAGGGFGTHPHKDMEIITYVLAGALSHQDSLGNQAVIVPGEVQRMTAGTGILHSEHNHDATNSTHLLQIWFKPNQLGLAPSYEQKMFATADKEGQLLLVASPTGDKGSVQLNADASLYAGLFDGEQTAVFNIKPHQAYYVFLAKGQLSISSTNLSTNHETVLNAGDALLINPVNTPATPANTPLTITLHQGQRAEVLIFECTL